MWSFWGFIVLVTRRFETEVDLTIELVPSTLFNPCLFAQRHKLRWKVKTTNPNFFEPPKSVKSYVVLKGLLIWRSNLGQKTPDYVSMTRDFIPYTGFLHVNIIRGSTTVTTTEPLMLNSWWLQLNTKSELLYRNYCNTSRDERFTYRQRGKEILSFRHSQKWL